MRYKTRSWSFTRSRTSTAPFLPHPSSDWLCVSSNAGTCTPTECCKREATMGFLTIFYKYITPTECCKREATMGFLTIFYKYIIQQYFTVTAPNTCTPTECCKREATMGFLTIFYKYIIQQYFTVTAPTAFAKYLKQIKYKMLILVHPQSAANVRLRWGF